MIRGVYGLGRFGSFWARTLAAGAPGDEVLVWSRHQHELPPLVRAVSEDELLSSCDELYFTVAISALQEVLGRVKGRIRPGTLVMDACSVKSGPASWMKEALGGEDVDIVATHPMFGPDSAAKGLAGLPIVTCPVKVPMERLTALEDSYRAMGLKVLRMSALEHDKQAAWSQGVTHFVGRTLSEMGLKDTEIATQGYKTLMTIVDQTCNDPMQLFCDLQRYNPYAKEMRLSLQVAIEKVLNKLRESEEGQP